MSRFSRFLHLERERTPQEGAVEPGREGPDAPERATRFNALETAAPEGMPSAVGATADGHLARFDAPRTGRLVLDEKRAEDQPFVRCARCEGDNNRFARWCMHCQNDLHSAEQRAFNEALWARLRAEREAEHAAHLERRKAELEAAAELAKERRAMYEKMAREVGMETRRRLEGDSWGSLFGRRARLHWQPRQLGIVSGGIVFVVLVLMLGMTIGWRATLKVLPVIVIGFGVAALRMWLRR